MIYFINFLCVQYGTTSFFKVLDKISVPQEESYHLNFSISSEVFNLPFIIGVFASFIVGTFVIKFLLKYIQNIHSLYIMKSASTKKSLVLKYSLIRGI